MPPALLRLPARRVLLPVLLLGSAVLLCSAMCFGVPCLRTGVRHGAWVDRCPATQMRLDLQVSAQNLRRGSDKGALLITPIARWLDGADRDAPEVQAVLWRGFSLAVVLLDADGNQVPGVEVERPKAKGRQALSAPISLPALPDGDYVLQVVADAGFDRAQVDVPLQLFAPAVVHTITDSPLYRPGQEVRFRAVVFDRDGLQPLEGRPGVWEVRDPRGNKMLQERAKSGPWGIVAGSFPLDSHASVGTWTVTWQTGDNTGQAAIEVRPFQLPRLTVSTRTAAPWFQAGDALVVQGRATYATGAPVARAPVAVSLRPQGGVWPMPVEWETPRVVTTAADGSFRVDYGAVPADLMAHTTLSAVAAVTEAAGERASGVASVVLSPDPISVQAVTELGDGLIGGFNNRAYLRVTTPDGVPLVDTPIVVHNPLDPQDAGAQATTDVDGVAVLQLDPGDPVTVVDPAPPHRVRPPVVKPPLLQGVRFVGTGGIGLTLAERRAVDRDVLPALADCQYLAAGDQRRTVGLRVHAGGGVRRVLSDDDPLSHCVAASLRRLRLPAGAERTLRMDWLVPDPGLPHLVLKHEVAWGSAEAVSARLDEAALTARRCLVRGEGTSAGRLLTLHWELSRGAFVPSTNVVLDEGGGLSPTALACVRSALRRVSLTEPAPASAMGGAVVSLIVPSVTKAAPPRPTTRTAYRLAVDTYDGRGSAVVLPVGDIPALRMRATPSLPTPGQAVTVELLRGPAWSGPLPDELALVSGSDVVAKAAVIDNGAVFQVPDDAAGFLHVRFAGARATLFVRRPHPLQVTIDTDKTQYAPGAEATLTVQTTAGGGPVAAGVSLIGVDETLGQLAPLPAVDDVGSVTVQARSERPAFGAFDARAVALGRVRGDNAAQAAVLRVSSLPEERRWIEGANGHGSVQAPAAQDTNVAFYRALEVAVRRVRTWEADAPEGEQMQPERMAKVWADSLDELRAAGAPAVDGFGRPLVLPALSDGFLAQLDPRRMVHSGTRLPEDVRSWTDYARGVAP